MTLRLYVIADAEALAQVYRDAVLSLGPYAYNEAQVQAWAQHPEDMEEFRATLAEGITLISIAGDLPVAFGQLNPVNHVAYLYTSPAHSGQGHASAIYEELESHAKRYSVDRIHTEASRLARPFFKRRGFSVYEIERPVRHGVVFERFRMTKDLNNR